MLHDIHVGRSGLSLCVRRWPMKRPSLVSTAARFYDISPSKTPVFCVQFPLPFEQSGNGYAIPAFPNSTIIISSLIKCNSQIQNPAFSLPLHISFSRTRFPSFKSPSFPTRIPLFSLAAIASHSLFLFNNKAFQ